MEKHYPVKNSGLSWIGRGGAILNQHDYIFISKNGQNPFLELQARIHELNDFCIALFDAISVKRHAATSFEQELNNSCSESDYYLAIDKFMFGYDESKLGFLFSPAASLVLLYATTIIGLKEIAKWYGPLEYSKWCQLKNSGQSEYNSLILLLEGISGSPISVFENRQVKILLRNRVREIRNDFMHGDWDGVAAKIDGVDVKLCFQTVSMIFEQLEIIFDERKAPFKERFSSQKLA